MHKRNLLLPTYSKASSTLSNYQKRDEIRAKWQDAMYRVYYKKTGKSMNPFHQTLIRIKRRQKDSVRAKIHVSIFSVYF